MVRDEATARRVPGRWMALAALAGVIGWAVKALYLMIASAIADRSLWLPANLAGATFDAFAPPAIGFAPAATLTGLALHLATGALWGLIFGALVFYGMPRLLRSTGRLVAAGLIVGLAYELVALAIGPLFNPYMATINAAIGWANVLVANLIFGMVTALTLRAILPKSRLSILMAPETARERTLH